MTIFNFNNCFLIELYRQTKHNTIGWGHKGTILPASQVFGMLPELKIRLNRSTYNAKNISGVDFMNSFLIISSPDALSFCNFLIHVKI